MEEKIGNEMRPRSARKMGEDSAQGGTRTRRSVSPLVVIVLILVLLLATTAYFAYTLFQEKMAREQILSTDDKKTIIANVEKHVIVIEGEDPVLATVTDPKELVGQPFFTNAQIGDKVLVYPVAGRAILYRPSIDRVVEMMPYDGGANAGL